MAVIWEVVIAANPEVGGICIFLGVHHLHRFISSETMMFHLILNLQQVEGSRSAEELMSTLQRVVEEQGSVLVASRVEEEERQLNRRLREEQDAAYQAGLQADQVCYYS